MEEFEIIDPYFMAKLLDGSQVIEWLLSQFSQRGLHNLTIKTKIQGNRNFAMMSEEVLIRSAAGALHSLKTKVGFEGKLKMELFRGFNHNRYFITTFRDGAFAFELGQGIDTFAREMVREGQKNHILSALEWKAIWGDTQMLTPHPSALRQANIDGVTSEVLIILAPKS
ncbi:MAG: hypothetical protein P8M68_01490 [Aquiluna sp.]|nr:hypothetical protein [Aquiluna sp.]